MCEYSYFAHAHYGCYDNFEGVTAGMVTNGHNYKIIIKFYGILKICYANMA